MEKTFQKPLNPFSQRNEIIGIVEAVGNMDGLRVYQGQYPLCGFIGKGTALIESMGGILVKTDVRDQILVGQDMDLVGIEQA